MTEYEARLRSVASVVNEMRATSGATSSALMFAFLSVILAKGKITDTDLETIFEVEMSQSRQTLKSYFDQNYGEQGFELQNAEEMKDAEKYVVEYINIIMANVKGAAESIKDPRRKKKIEGE